MGWRELWGYAEGFDNSSYIWQNTYKEFNMAIASMVCGITGLLGFIFSSIRILNLMKYSNTFGDSLFGAFFQMQLQNQMTTAIVFAIISFVLIILAFIFGIIERKKGKEYKYYCSNYNV